MLVGKIRIRAAEPPAQIRSMQRARVAFIRVCDYRHHERMNREAYIVISGERRPYSKLQCAQMTAAFNRAEAYAKIADKWQRALQDWFNRQTGYAVDPKD